MVSNIPPLPLSYRSEILKSVLANVRAGECCSLIGIGGTGKSNLGRFLQRHDVQQAYWKDTLSWVILIDAHSLVFGDEKSEYSLIELMIQRLIAEAESRGFDSTFLLWSQDLYKHLITASATQALRALQDLCKRLCEGYGLQVVFVFDQFENLWKVLDARFFLNLRGLRDQFKYRIIYVTMTRDRLQALRQDAQVVEAFWELFSAHTYYLGPYSEDDTVAMLERLARRAGITRNAVPSEVALLSGRHPGLLRAIFWALRDTATQSLSIDSLLQVSAVNEECAKIWSAFSSDEQQVIWLIAQDLSLPHSSFTIVQDLQSKGIVHGDPPALFSALFTAYVLRKLTHTVSGVVVDLRSRQVRIDGRLLPHNLSSLEFRLLAYLARHSGAVCRHKELIQALYGEPVYDKSDQRLYALLGRLRETLGENAQSSRYLITHRGGGIQLLQGSVANDEAE